MTKKNITLQSISTTNPFEDYPELRTIWPSPFIDIAEEAIVENLELQKNDPDYLIGGLYYILEEDLKEKKVIGITGFFIYNEEITDLGLRWHGLLPEKRGLGYSKEALLMVCLEANKLYPVANDLIELVPQNEYGKLLEQHFSNIGFKKVGVAEKYDWADFEWQPYHLNIKKFLIENDKIINVKKLKF